MIKLKIRKNAAKSCQNPTSLGMLLKDPERPRFIKSRKTGPKSAISNNAAKSCQNRILFFSNYCKRNPNMQVSFNHANLSQS